MKRLPGYDSRTSRAELAAFSGLGLVGAALITAAVSNAIKFAEARDCIIAELSAPGSTGGAVASASAKNTFTNLLRVHNAEPPEPHLMIPACSGRSQGQSL